jgi:hypothetical protein
MCGCFDFWLVLTELVFPLHAAESSVCQICHCLRSAYEELLLNCLLFVFAAFLVFLFVCNRYLSSGSDAWTLQWLTPLWLFYHMSRCSGIGSWRLTDCRVVRHVASCIHRHRRHHQSFCKWRCQHKDPVTYLSFTFSDADFCQPWHKTCSQQKQNNEQCLLAVVETLQ